MSDDAAYSSFLDKANQPTGATAPTSQSKSSAATTKSASSANVPPALKNISATYTSDTDAPFEPVGFDYDSDSLPSAHEFGKLVGAKGEVEELSVQDFDPRGEYGDVVGKVKGAVDGSGVRVFRVGRGKTRAEYFVVGLQSGSVVGVKAEAVES